MERRQAALDVRDRVSEIINQEYDQGLTLFQEVKEFR